MKYVIAALCISLFATALYADDTANEMRDTLLIMQSLDARVATVGQKLQIANTALCKHHIPVAGLVFQGLEQYKGPYEKTASQLFSLNAAPGVAVVVPGSVADQAGVKTGDALLAINGVMVPNAAPDDGGYDRMAKLLYQFEAALIAGPVQLSLRRGTQEISVTLSGQPGCATRFQMVPGPKMGASADGQYVTISSAMAAWADSDDDLAVLLSHELAHNILEHRKQLFAKGVTGGMFDKIGKGAALTRETEIEADIYSLKLMTNAGYNVHAAPAFWRRFGPKFGYGILSAPTHLRWKKRAALLDAEIAKLPAAKK